MNILLRNGKRRCRWIAEAAVQFPTMQNLNGNALELDSIARAGVRFNF